MSQNTPKPKRPIRLPFEKRKNSGDWGSWIYRHRSGILVTASIYLLGMIVFLSYRIALNTISTEMITIEFEKEQEPEKLPTPEELKQQEVEKMQSEAFEKVQNRIRDEGSKLNSELRDAKKSDASEIYKDAERVARELAEGKEAYERGMQELQKTGQKKSKKTEQNESSKDTKGNQRENVKGRVIVSYFLEGRHDVYLYKPAYQCQYGGTVVVAITVNRNGKVTNAVIDKSTTTSDDCIMQMAVQAAYASTFNTSQSAPDKQKGTITYEFIAQ